MGRGRRISGLIWPAVRVVIDAVAVEAALLASYWLRFDSAFAGFFRDLEPPPPLRAYFVASWVVVAVFMGTSAVSGQYRQRRQTSAFSESLAALGSVTKAAVIVAAIAFFYRRFSFSRAVMFLGWATIAVVVGACRVCILRLERSARAGRGVTRRGAVVGTGRWGAVLYERANTRLEPGLTLEGFFVPNGPPVPGAPVLGTVSEVGSAARRLSLDTLYVALGTDDDLRLADVMDACADLDVELCLVPDAVELASRKLRTWEIGGVPVLKIRSTSIGNWGRIIKRAFDVVASILGLACLGPLLLLVASAVRLQGRGPVLLRQERIGLDGRAFRMLKFRTMVVDAERETGPVWTIEGDERVTPLGRALRRWCIDELPQLFNVLQGSMSLVGPRPERSVFVEQFRKEAPAYLERLRVKSGITGWAQVSGYRGNTPIGPRIAYDIFYIENWSLLLDFRILLLTIWVVVAGKGSY